REALWQITEKRLKTQYVPDLLASLNAIFQKYKLDAAQVTIVTPGTEDHLSFGSSKPQTWFEMASLSKTVGTAFAIEYLTQQGIHLDAPVDEVLASKTSSKFRLNDSRVTIAHLMSHSA